MGSNSVVTKGGVFSEQGNGIVGEPVSSTFVVSVSFDETDSILTVDNSNTDDTVIDLSGGQTVTYDLTIANRDITLTGSNGDSDTISVPLSPDTNTFVDSATFNSGAGVITFSGTDITPFTVDISDVNTDTLVDQFDISGQVITLGLDNNTDFTVTIPESSSDEYAVINSNGTVPVAGGTDSIAIGEDASVSSGSTDGIAIGKSAAVVNGIESIAVGKSARADGIGSLAVGINTKAEEDNTVAIGNAAEARAIHVITIGGNGGASPQLAELHRQTESGDNDLHIATKKYVDDNSGGGALDELTDVTLTTPTDNQVLTFDNNTSMWVNEATQSDDLKANLASPALTGTPTAPTADEGTDTTQIATTAFVLANSSGGSDFIVDSYAGTVPTALGDDALAIGDLAQADANDSIAIGREAIISDTTATRSIAIGSLAGATGASSVAIGRNAFVKVNDSVAIGHNSLSELASEIRLGGDVGLSRVTIPTDRAGSETLPNELVSKSYVDNRVGHNVDFIRDNGIPNEIAFTTTSMDDAVEYNLNNNADQEFGAYTPNENIILPVPVGNLEFVEETVWTADAVTGSKSLDGEVALYNGISGGTIRYLSDDNATETFQFRYVQTALESDDFFASIVIEIVLLSPEDSLSGGYIIGSGVGTIESADLGGADVLRSVNLDILTSRTHPGGTHSLNNGDRVGIRGRFIEQVGSLAEDDVNHFFIFNRTTGDGNAFTIQAEHQVVDNSFAIDTAGNLLLGIGDTDITVYTASTNLLNSAIVPEDTDKADLASPDFTGTPTAPTADEGTDTTQIATTAFVLANQSGGGSSITFNNGTEDLTTALESLTVSGSGVTVTEPTDNNIALVISGGGSGEDYVLINSDGTQPLAGGADAIAIGEGVNAQGTSNVAIGLNSSTDGLDSVAIGSAAQAQSANSGAFGANSSARADNIITIGGAGSTPQTAELARQTTSGDNDLAIATKLYVDENGGGEDYLVINSDGTLPDASGTDAIALGESSSATMSNATAIGTGATANFDFSAAIGNSASATKDSETMLGADSIVNTVGVSGVSDVLVRDEGFVLSNAYPNSRGSALFDISESVDSADWAAMNFSHFKRALPVPNGATEKGFYYYTSDQSSLGGFSLGDLASTLKFYGTNAQGWLLRTFQYNSDGDLSVSHLTWIEADATLSAIFTASDFRTLAWAVDDSNNSTPVTDNAGSYTAGTWTGFDLNNSNVTNRTLLGTVRYFYADNGDLEYTTTLGRNAS